MKRNIDFLTNNLIAHRGYYNNKSIPENSIKAFKKALKYNYLIELDVHLTKDNKLVVFHDSNLMRMTGSNLKIENSSYKSLVSFPLIGTSERIPLLTEVLDLVNGKVPIIIELKCNKFNLAFIKEFVRTMDLYEGEFAVKSFNHFLIYYLKKLRPNYIRGVLSCDYSSSKKITFNKFIAKYFILNGLIKPDFISYDIRSMPNKFLLKRKEDILLLGWTIKNKEDYIKGKQYFDNLICENLNDIIK